jgi:hypothetical protein
MADEKISAMPASTAAGDTDLIPIVQGGVNKSTTRAVLLHAATGSPVILGGGGASITVDDSGNIAIDFFSGQTLNVAQTSGGGILVDASGNVKITCQPGASVAMTDGSSFIEVDATGVRLESLTLPAIFTGKPAQFVDISGSSAFVTYVPADPGAWAGSPTNMADAIDRIAEVVSVGGATPIP